MIILVDFMAPFGYHHCGEIKFGNVVVGMVRFEVVKIVDVEIVVIVVIGYVFG